LTEKRRQFSTGRSDWMETHSWTLF